MGSLPKPVSLLSSKLPSYLDFEGIMEFGGEKNHMVCFRDWFCTEMILQLRNSTNTCTIAFYL